MIAFLVPCGGSEAANRPRSRASGSLAPRPGRMGCGPKSVPGATAGGAGRWCMLICDLTNAGYWYRRAGVPLSDALLTDE